jgi:hypothetical protein
MYDHLGVLLLSLPAGGDVADLTSGPLDPLIGAFSLVNALRPLEPCGGQGRVLLAFNPPDCCEYQEILTLRWGPWLVCSLQMFWFDCHGSRLIMVIHLV